MNIEIFNWCLLYGSVFQYILASTTVTENCTSDSVHPYNYYINIDS